jgi:hypothetical protein
MSSTHYRKDGCMPRLQVAISPTPVGYMTNSIAPFQGGQLFLQPSEYRVLYDFDIRHSRQVAQPTMKRTHPCE